MKAYNIVFGVEGKNVVSVSPEIHPSNELDIPKPDRTVDGWAGRAGPNIAWEQWPRNVSSKTPMFHCLTLKLPEEYRVKSTELVAISFFQGGGDKKIKTSLFSKLDADFKKYTPHPQYTELTDIIDGKFGYIWLTEEEFNKGPQAPKPDMRTKREKEWHKKFSFGGIGAWNDYDREDDVQYYVPAWLIEREDPNAGKAPVDEWGIKDGKNIDGYVPIDYENDEEFWCKLGGGFSHLGGTCFAVQDIPRFDPPLTPFYLELENFPGMNLGDAGNMQLDLKTGNFDWACG